jgi:glutamate racemase
VFANSPIVILDSSLGGLAIVKALRDVLPGERVTFFADIGRAPYAHRSPERVRQMSLQMLRQVAHQRPKHVLLADDMMSTVALPWLRAHTGGAAVSGVIDAAARVAVEAAGGNERPMIGAIASHWTIDQRTLERAIVKRRYRAQTFVRPAAALEAILQDGRSVNDPLLQLACAQLLQPMLDRHVDVLLLVNPLLGSIRRHIQTLAGEATRVVDAGRAVADDLVKRLTRSHLLAHEPANEPAPFEWFLTDESPEIFDRAERIAGVELPPPGIVGLDELELADVDVGWKSIA